VAAPPRVAVATSGGRDSTALLHCTLAQARPLGVEVWALHVHHGLLPEADAWQARVQRQATRWGARFATERLAGAPAKGDSVEAWARQGRYVALARLAQAAGCPLVLLAHHRRDQAETWLLQALRGAGSAGLSAMPRHAQRDGLVWARPWLDQPRQAIEAYARRHRLRAVHDPSNDDPRFARGRLRSQVWPALQAAFPQTDTVLAMAARHAQAAHALADEVAAADLARVQQGDALRLAPWLELTPARRANVLRAWLAERLGQGAPQTLVDRLLAEAPAGAAPARWPAPGGVVQRRRGELRVLVPPAAPAADTSKPTGRRQRPL
jgi:tRNA(Ile)-lysidine synthase